MLGGTVGEIAIIVKIFVTIKLPQIAIKLYTRGDGRLNINNSYLKSFNDY